MLIKPPMGFIVAVAAMLSFTAGWTVNGWRYKTREAKAIAAALVERDKANERANAIAADFEMAKVALNERSYETTTKIRTVYRDRKISADCAVPAGAASLLNDARNATNAAVTGKPGSTVSDSERLPAE